MGVVFAVAILTEALVEYGKTVIGAWETGEIKTFVTQCATIILGIFMSFAFHINVFVDSGFTVAPVIGTVITGIIISRGSNYASDILNKITSF